jgi:hypothetical protein
MGEYEYEEGEGEEEESRSSCSEEQASPSSPKSQERSSSPHSTSTSTDASHPHSQDSADLDSLQDSAGASQDAAWPEWFAPAWAAHRFDEDEGWEGACDGVQDVVLAGEVRRVLRFSFSFIFVLFLDVFFFFSDVSFVVLLHPHSPLPLCRSPPFLSSPSPALSRFGNRS